MSPHDAKPDNNDDDSDEYSFDDLDGIDLDSIPWLCVTQPTNEDLQSSQSHQSTGQPHDHSTPQDLPHVVEHGTSHAPSTSSLPGGSSATTEATGGPSSTTERSSTPSTDYGLEDDVDEEFLQAVDKLESELLSQVKQTSSDSHSSAEPSTVKAFQVSSTNLTATTSQPTRQANVSCLSQGTLHVTPHSTTKTYTTTLGEVPPHDASRIQEQGRLATRMLTPQKRRSIDNENENESASTDDHTAPSVERIDGRSQKKVKKLLEDFEEEISCPICFDLFACAYLFNPCGHSYCGGCALGWMEKNKDAPLCAVCRTRINKRGAMIANIALDSAVQRHVDALAENGDIAWQQGGEKLREWTKRKEEWKLVGTKRMTDVLKPRKTRRK